MPRMLEFQSDIEQKIKPRPPYRSQLPPWRSSKSKRSRISVDSFIIIIRPFHLLLLPLRLVQTHAYTCTYVITYIYAHVFPCLLLFLAPPFLPLLNSIAFRISHEAAIIMATNLGNGQLDYNKMHFIFRLPFSLTCSIWIC